MEKFQSISIPDSFQAFTGEYSALSNRHRSRSPMLRLDVEPPSVRSAADCSPLPFRSLSNRTFDASVSASSRQAHLKKDTTLHFAERGRDTELRTIRTRIARSSVPLAALSVVGLFFLIIGQQVCFQARTLRFYADDNITCTSGVVFTSLSVPNVHCIRMC